jgi:2-C-methyl-D-erythritol 4-phosphate cytidylyltransferase
VKPSRRDLRPGAAVAIVPAGGWGTRLGSRIPKQYLAVGGVPLLVLTVRALGRARAVQQVVVAAPEPRVEATRALLRRYRLPRPVAVVAGGATRQASVWRALQAAPPSPRWILVHDAARPFVTAALVEAVLAAARRHGAATGGLPVNETIKRVRDGRVEETLDRAGLWMIQTPQAFRRELLWEAHDKACRAGRRGTDDAVLVEWLGAPVAVVPGSSENLKITTREDLRAARRWMGRGRR